MIGWFLLITPFAIASITLLILWAASIQYRRAKIIEINDYPKFAKFINGINDYLSTTAGICIIISVVLIMAVVAKQTNSITFVKKYEVISVEYSNRADNSLNFERIALFQSAAEMTGEAAVLQYWNKYFDPFITDEVDNLKPMR